MAPSQKETTSVSDEDSTLLEQMREAAIAGEPGTLNIGDVVNQSNEDAPFPMVAKDVSSAGYVWVYDRVTGDPSRVNRNMLPYILRKTNPATGNYVFTTRDPGFRPAEGTFKCDLHPESPLREKFDKLGMVTCNKSNLKTEWDKMRHMQRRHPSEYSIQKEDEYKQEREADKADRQADREFRNKLLEMLVNQGNE